MTHRPTALITGASSGLGVEFARRFATQGHNLVLVARRLHRLEALADELRQEYGIDALPLAADLSRPEAANEIVGTLTGRGVSVQVLVNNAGVGYSTPLSRQTAAETTTQLGVNVVSLVELTRLLLPQLVAADHGLILNVASLAGHAPIAGMAVYSAAKAFVLQFSDALWAELRHTNVRVLVVSPGATETEFWDISHTDRRGVTFQSAAQVVDAAMRGLRTNKPGVVSGRTNNIAANASRFLTRRRAALLSAQMSHYTPDHVA